jgi:flavin-dependent dehydrogenase
MRSNTEFKVAERTPVTIVGAGPAGLACAIVLARQGREVVVREWKDTVGHRFHNDFQGLENWSNFEDCLVELAASGVTPEFEHNPVYETTAFDTKGRAHEIHSPRPLYYLLRRGAAAGSLDRGLLVQAQAEGVEVRFNDRVYHTRGPTILAAGPRRANVIAAGYLFETNHDNGSWFSIDQKLAPGGYAYLLVHEGRGTLASCMYAKFDRQAGHVELARTFFAEKLGIEMNDLRKFGGYGSRSHIHPPVQGGHPVIGEQAGFQDALAGFGLRYAMNSGILAARCLLEGRDYADAWRHEILPRVKTGIANRLIFETMGRRAHNWALRGLARAGGDPVKRLQRLYAPNGLTRLIYPLAAWRNRKSGKLRSCSHGGCDCVWCQQCQTEISPISTQSNVSAPSDQ